MNYNQFSSIYVEESQFSREKLQFFFDTAFKDADADLLRSQYKALRDLEFKTKFDFVTESVDISTLFENLTYAFDVFASTSGVNFIYCGNTTSPIMGNARILAKAFLNLLSNAFLYGNSKLVTIKTLEIDHHIQIEVQSGGFFPFHNSSGRGLSFVQRTCNYLNGQFLIESKKDSSKAIMCFKRIESPKPHTDTRYDFQNLLSDRLSPVYVEIFGMCYH
jgi:signal transduction histidine kinase